MLIYKPLSSCQVSYSFTLSPLNANQGFHLLSDSSAPSGSDRPALPVGALSAAAQSACLSQRSLHSYLRARPLGCPDELAMERTQSVTCLIYIKCRTRIQTQYGLLCKPFILLTVSSTNAQSNLQASHQQTEKIWRSWSANRSGVLQVCGR